MKINEDIEFQVIRCGRMTARYDFGYAINEQVAIMLQRMAGTKCIEERLDMLKATEDRLHFDWLSTEAGITIQNRIWGKKAKEDIPVNLPFNDKTPLSALFQSKYHSMLRSIIDSWKPNISGIPQGIDTLAITKFQFDFKKIKAASIYIDIGQLLTEHALVDDNMKTLAWYLFLHSNLSKSFTALYVQLRTYKKR